MQAFARQGEKAVGLSGFDGGLIQAERRKPQKNADGKMVDFGQVGDVLGVNYELITAIHETGAIPVISPLAGGLEGEPLNVNADTIASELAMAMGATKLILLTRAPGILTLSLIHI